MFNQRYRDPAHPISVNQYAPKANYTLLMFGAIVKWIHEVPRGVYITEIMFCLEYVIDKYKSHV